MKSCSAWRTKRVTCSSKVACGVDHGGSTTAALGTFPDHPLVGLLQPCMLRPSLERSLSAKLVTSPGSGAVLGAALCTADSAEGALAVLL